jgi:hypothetical protein
MSPVPVDNRKDLLLLVLAAANGEPVVGFTRLQKYLYLLQREYHWDEVFGIADPYRFEAHNYGPFDAQVYGDLEFLENLKLVTRRAAGEEPVAESAEMRQVATEAASDPEFAPWEDEDVTWEWSLTERGKGFAADLELDAEHAAQLDQLKHTWNQRSLTALLRWLYKTYPESASETVLKHLKPA